MTNPTGYRRGTRDMFSRAYKTKGVEHLSTYLKVYKIGDIVDIKGNGAFQKGMPHKSYHGKTGRVFNVSKHALGVIVNKRVRGRIIGKRISIRVERQAQYLQNRFPHSCQEQRVVEKGRQRGWSRSPPLQKNCQATFGSPYCHY